MWEKVKGQVGLGKKLRMVKIFGANGPRRPLSGTGPFAQKPSVPGDALHAALDRSGSLEEQAVALPQEPSFQALKRMHEHNVSQLLVFADGTPLGTVHRDQILNLALEGQDLRKLSVGDVMSQTMPEVRKTSTAKRLGQVLGPGPWASSNVDEA